MEIERERERERVRQRKEKKEGAKNAKRQSVVSPDLYTGAVIAQSATTVMPAL